MEEIEWVQSRVGRTYSLAYSFDPTIVPKRILAVLEAQMVELTRGMKEKAE